MSGALIVISGPAGAGKGTLVSRLAEALPHCWLSISATTRAPRGSERDGVEYFFKSVHDFEAGIEAGDFIEWACVHSNYYGTPLSPIIEHVAAGDIVLLEIDVRGAFQVREKLPEAKLVFIAPPSMAELERRLRGRGTDSEESIAIRLANAAGEMEASALYDRVVINDDLDGATEELLQVINSYVGH